MNEYVIECYDTLNTKGFTDKLIIGYFNDQPIPYNYYNFLNDNNGDDNNIIDTTVEDALLEKRSRR